MIEIYNEKENFQTDPNIPEVNKVTDDDMNQLREAVIQGVYQGTCTDEELEQAIEDINKDTNKVLKDKNNKILDFIVPRYENFTKDYESGSNDLGNYIKYSDGTMIQYQRYATTVNIGGVWGSLFFGSISCPDYPQPFVNTEPTVTATVYPTTESWCLGNLVYSSGQQQNLLSAGTVMCIRPQATDNLPVVIEIIAIGRWK